MKTSKDISFPIEWNLDMNSTTVNHILRYKSLWLGVLIIPAFKGDSRETHQNDDNACRLSVSRVAGSVWIPAFRWNDDLGEYGNDDLGEYGNDGRLRKGFF